MANMEYKVLSDIVPEGPYKHYSDAVKTIESYGLKEHKPYSPWSGNLYVEVKSDHYWRSVYWHDACCVGAQHIAYIIPANATEVRSSDKWDDELPYMTKRVNEAAEMWCTNSVELRRAMDQGIVDFSTGYEREPTCVIGNVWFYFAGEAGRDKLWQEYRDEVGIDVMLEQVAAVLNDPIEYGIDWDESVYAISYIREGLHDAYKLRREKEWEEELARRRANYLKVLERYTDDELEAEINRRKAAKEN